MELRPLAGKIALITGGARGIGRAITDALADAGAGVAVNYQTSREAAEHHCAELRERGVTAEPFPADVADEAQAAAMVERVHDTLGSVDILVNNAGIARDKSFLKMTKLMWDEVLGVNLNGPFNVTHAVLPDMVERGWGRVINITSVVGQTGNFGQANYAVTKGGLIAFTMTLAREVARKGVTVNAVAPGYVETDLLRDVPASVLDQVKAMTPVGRLGKPEEIAFVVACLACPAAAYVTGQIIPVNGGMYM